MTTRRELAEMRRTLARVRVAEYVRSWKAREQLVSITNGMDVERYIAEKQAESIAALRRIKTELDHWIERKPPRPRLLERIKRRWRSFAGSTGGSI